MAVAGTDVAVAVDPVDAGSHADTVPEYDAAYGNEVYDRAHGGDAVVAEGLQQNAAPPEEW